VAKDISSLTPGECGGRGERRPCWLSSCCLWATA
jgi:hypothetical protein